MKTFVYPNLPDVIRQVQIQLETAQQLRVQDGGSKFLRLKQLEFEMKCVAVESDSVDGGFDLKVVRMGSGTKFEDQQVHTVKIVFEGTSDFVNGKCNVCDSMAVARTKDGFMRCSTCGAVGSCG